MGHGVLLGVAGAACRAVPGLFRPACSTEQVGNADRDVAEAQLLDVA
jgi:hypothetical protein